MLTSYSDIVNDLTRFTAFGQNEIGKNGKRAKNLISGQKNTSLDGYNQKAGYYICKQRREYQGEYDRRFSKSV